LSAQEEAVIVRRGTEAPFSGQYVKSAGKGAYACKRCGTVLFRSSDKFDSECGWPSFDEARHGTVLRLPDADGRRVEVVCATCGAHLGHLFEGEGLTKKNARYCVNSISLDFARDDAAQTGAPKVKSEVPKVKSDLPKAPARETALFASGCFWGSEYIFHEAPGVLETTVGYTGGRTEHPTYGEVCSGRTGHAEAVQVVFDPGKTSYEALVRIFFETHDFTQVDRQGPDVGTQYRSEIHYLTKEQKETAEKVIQTLLVDCGLWIVDFGPQAAQPAN
jgi:peptide methionine sulfoxide reductase msrA/msrB